MAMSLVDRAQRKATKGETMATIHIPSHDEFARGCQQYEAHEKRDAMYKVATFLVSHFWGAPADMADGLGVLLRTWNHAFYRYGLFDFDELEQSIANNMDRLDALRRRDILSLSDADEEVVEDLFLVFLQALQIHEGKAGGRKSPVGASKALHLLAPGFFPLWDARIAEAYGCSYHGDPVGKYIQFCRITQQIADVVQNYVPLKDKTLVKLIDEYNYSKYTQGWI
jgi:hypothetical protein